MDPAALERRLVKDLEAVRLYREAEQRYREVMARYGGEAPNGSGELPPPPPMQLPLPPPRERGTDSLVGAVEKHLAETWHKASYYEEKAREARSTTTAGAVRSTLRRLVEAGVAEKRGDKKSGNVEYRRKPAAS